MNLVTDGNWACVTWLEHKAWRLSSGDLEEEAATVCALRPDRRTFTASGSTEEEVIGFLQRRAGRGGRVGGRRRLGRPTGKSTANLLGGGKQHGSLGDGV